MKGLLRFLAGVFFLVAVMAAVNDVTRSMATDKAVTTSTYEHWSKLAPKTFDAARGAIGRGTHPVVWDWALAPLLGLPAWGLFGLAGLICAYVGRRRREVNIFAN
jgi:hypothetical protein